MIHKIDRTISCYRTIFIHAYIFYNISDPVIAATFEALLEDIPTAILEIFRTKAAYYFFIFLQNYICDFGATPVLQNDCESDIVFFLVDYLLF